MSAKVEEETEMSTDGTDSWGTVGVDFNIIDASWEALRESLEYYLSRGK